MVIFSDAQGQLTLQSISDLAEYRTHPILYSCPQFKNVEGPIKNEGARVLTTMYIDSLDKQGQLTPQYVDFFRISNSFVCLWLS